MGTQMLLEPQTALTKPETDSPKLKRSNRTKHKKYKKIKKRTKKKRKDPEQEPASAKMFTPVNPDPTMEMELADEGPQPDSKAVVDQTTEVGPTDQDPEPEPTDQDTEPGSKETIDHDWLAKDQERHKQELRASLWSEASDQDPESEPNYQKPESEPTDQDPEPASRHVVDHDWLARDQERH